MKTLLLSATALFALTAAASAADLPSRYTPAPIVAAVPVFTWTGFYVGAQAGYAWGEDSSSAFFDGEDVSADFFETGNTDFDADGFVGGVHAGYNVQFGSFVAGVEADIEAAGIDGERTFDFAVGGFNVSSEINFQGSLRARAGVAFDRALLYVTGGLAFANIENTYSFEDGVESDSFEDTQWGWTIGAGVEYAFTNNLTARVEYRFTQFDNQDNSLDLVEGLSIEQEPEFHTVRAGISYKFGTY